MSVIAGISPCYNQIYPEAAPKKQKADAMTY